MLKVFLHFCYFHTTDPFNLNCFPTLCFVLHKRAEVGGGGGGFCFAFGQFKSLKSCFGLKGMEGIYLSFVYMVGLQEVKVHKVWYENLIWSLTFFCVLDLLKLCIIILNNKLGKVVVDFKSTNSQKRVNYQKLEKRTNKL